jgi:hypothetical protein
VTPHALIASLDVCGLGLIRCRAHNRPDAFVRGVKHDAYQAQSCLRCGWLQHFTCILQPSHACLCCAGFSHASGAVQVADFLEAQTQPWVAAFWAAVQPGRPEDADSAGLALVAAARPGIVTLLCDGHPAVLTA